MNSIKKHDLEFLTNEIKTWQDEEIITYEQGEKILNLYEIKKRPLRMILLIAGGILIGLGGISFIGAHWYEIPKLIRVSVILATYIASVLIYYFLGAKESKLARSFLIFGSCIIGAGIFLITRMYNYKLTESSGTGYWLIGLFIVSALSRDEWQLYLLEAIGFLHLLFSGAIDIFALQFMEHSRVSLMTFFEPPQAILIIIGLYLICRYINDKIANNIAMLLTLGVLASRMTLCLGGTASLIILVTMGIIISFIPNPNWNEAENFGLLMAGFLGLLLTLPEFWRGEIFNQEIFGFAGKSFFSVITAIILAIIMLLQIYKGRIVAGGVFFALLLARYFFDRLFGYLPKAWGFTIIGIIFLIAGLFFEKITRKKSIE